MPVHRRLRLHLQSIGRHAVQGLEDAIEPGENAQMPLHVVQLTVFKHRRPHGSILYAIIGMDRRGQIGSQMSYYAFEMLYWCGIREGELLALTPADFNFTKKTVRINKTYQRIHGQDLITSPKTRKSVRTVEMPDFLCDEMQDYLKSLYKVQKNERIFPITKSYLQHEMRRGSKEADVKRIRIHDLRHSHISLLIDMGFSAVAIADRVGHESIDITFRYAHMFPSRQVDMAQRLNNERMEGQKNVS